jgi:hypothetical protein
LVKASLDRGLKVNVTAEAPILPIVPQPGQQAQPAEVGAASHPDQADMRLRLSRLEWVEGGILDGWAPRSDSPIAASSSSTNPIAGIR